MIFDFGVVVTLPVEETALKNRLEGAKERLLPNALPFTQGTLEGFSVIVAKSTAQGSVCSALAASDLLREFQPRYLVLLGIAAGFPDEVRRGDVVIGDPIIGYEYSKVYDDSTDQEPRTFRPPQRPIESFSRESIALTVPNKSEENSSQVKIGPIASGSKLVAAETFRNNLVQLNRKICALEMEAEGVAQTARHTGREFFVIKGISDFADTQTKGARQSEQERKEHDQWQEYAASASVEAFVQFLTHCKNKRIIVPSVTENQQTVVKEPWPTQPLAREEAFLRVARGPSLKLGQLDLKCKLMPAGLWAIDQRGEYIFFDEPEQRQRIQLDLIDAQLPKETLAQLVGELKSVLENPGSNTLYSPIQLDQFKEAHRRLTDEGSAAYPRVVAPPEIEKSADGTTFLRIVLAPSRFGIALVEERQFPLTTAKALRFKYVLNSLAVRVAVVYNKNNETWIEFHQRKGPQNATYKDAWDVGAAGYINPSKHKDPEDRERISPWQACAYEVEEELNIPKWNLQNREHFYFLGVGRNDPTGQLDLLAVCELAEAPDPQRDITHRVTRYDRCLLTPESVANFVLEKEYWVPTALLTLILLLQSPPFNFKMPRIEAAFSRCVGKIKLDP